jgi:dihydrofolate reductase
MLNLIVAVANNGVIADHGEIPWTLPTDMRRFRLVTMGRKIIMGRKTFEQVGLLQGRDIYVASRNMEYQQPEGTTLVREFWRFIEEHENTTEQVYVAGGAQMYEQALPHCTRLYITLVNAEPAGNTILNISNLPANWLQVHRQDFKGLVGHSADFSFIDMLNTDKRTNRGIA